MRGVAATLFLASCGAACAPHTVPEPVRPSQPPSVEVRVDVAQEWSESGLSVHKGDRIVVWATGEARERKSPDRPFGPDGINMSGRVVGRGGLIGRVGDGKRFDIGSRDHLLWVAVYHTLRQVAPGPIEITEEGQLRLGAKDWKPNRYSGTFVVSIWSRSS